jgi:poly(3-hydroxybutyrate) depolymerase
VRPRSAVASLLGGVVACAGLLGAAPAAGADGLPRLAIEPGALTVSGVSSGGYMATQFHVSFSGVVRGIGVFGAGPWDCARGSIARAFGDCLGRAESAPDAAALVARARAAAAAGHIDPPDGLARARVWIFHGTRDATVAAPVTRALADFYLAFVATTALRYLDDRPVGHGIPTATAGAPCEVTAAPYLNACGYDGVGEMLSFLHGDAPASAPPGATGTLRRFEQSRYDSAGSLAPQGYLYVPQACAGRDRCRLHVAFHGCRQGADFVGESFVRDAGYNRWADAHRLVVLYPQTRRSPLLPMNPDGCWDWWGYTDEHYATRDGPQVAAVRAMVRALAGF